MKAVLMYLYGILQRLGWLVILVLGMFLFIAFFAPFVMLFVFAELLKYLFKIEFINKK